MTPLGIGLDLVEVERVVRLLESKGERAWHRLLTDEEREYCRTRAVPARHVAARLAAKEAAYKAFAHGCEPGFIGWCDVEVGRAVNGRPALEFHGRARRIADRLSVASSLLSLSHTEHYAAAVVVLLG